MLNWWVSQSWHFWWGNATIYEFGKTTLIWRFSPVVQKATNEEMRSAAEKYIRTSGLEKINTCQW
jgi:hypothetical protein